MDVAGQFSEQRNPIDRRDEKAHDDQNDSQDYDVSTDVLHGRVLLPAWGLDMIG